MTYDAPGAPYHEGDPIAVEIDGTWREGEVHAIARHDEPQRFGLAWAVIVALTGAFHTVHVDDNGRNFRYREQVCPSARVVA